MIRCPQYLADRTPDTCAECLSGLGDSLIRKLWQLRNDMESDNPISDMNAVTLQEYELEAFDRYPLKKVWDKLSQPEQELLIQAAKKEGWDSSYPS